MFYMQAGDVGNNGFEILQLALHAVQQGGVLVETDANEGFK
jgi:hypothetical protein